MNSKKLISPQRHRVNNINDYGLAVHLVTCISLCPCVSVVEVSA